MEKKFRLTNETINFNGVTLYRIEALRDFSDIKVGDKGGYIEKEGNLSQCGDAWVYGDAVIESQRDYIVFKNFWSSGRYFTYTRSNKKWKVGCFYGTGEELIKKAYLDSKESGWQYEQVVRYVEAVEKGMNGQ